MKRVLIVTYYWPPSGGSGVQRWVKFAKYLPARGWQPVVYTHENPELTTIDKTLAAEIPPEVEIVKSRIFEPYGIYRKLMGKGVRPILRHLQPPMREGRGQSDQRAEEIMEAEAVTVHPRQFLHSGSTCDVGAPVCALP